MQYGPQMAQMGMMSVPSVGPTATAVNVPSGPTAATVSVPSNHTSTTAMQPVHQANTQSQQTPSTSSSGTFIGTIDKVRLTQERSLSVWVNHWLVCWSILFISVATDRKQFMDQLAHPY